jgi:hypothetical protein
MGKALTRPRRFSGGVSLLPTAVGGDETSAVRLVGRVAGPEEAKAATRLRGTGAERLLGRGDFLPR